LRNTPLELVMLSSRTYAAVCDVVFATTSSLLNEDPQHKPDT